MSLLEAVGSDRVADGGIPLDTERRTDLNLGGVARSYCYRSFPRLPNTYGSNGWCFRITVPALFGVSLSTIGVVVAILWLFELGVTLYRYANGTRSREQSHLEVSVGLFWFALSLLLIGSDLTGTIETALAALAAGVFLAGIVAGVRWLRIRNADSDGEPTA